MEEHILPGGGKGGENGKSHLHYILEVRRRFTQLLKPAVGGSHRLEVLENLAVEVDTQIPLAGPGGKW